MADFATVAELETLMGTSGLGARGTAMLGYASALIRREVGMDIEETLGRQEQFAGDPTRLTIVLSQVPVTAVTVDVDGTALTAFSWDRWTGQLYRDDGMAWAVGPITVTYDSGYTASSDEMIATKLIALEVAARALNPGPVGFDTVGPETAELRGGPVGLFLTPAEQRELQGLGRVAVA